MGARITRPEAAEIAGVAPDTFSSYVNRGHAPKPVEYVGRTGLWDEDEVRAWQASRPGQGGWATSRERNRVEANAGDVAVTTTARSETCSQAIGAAAAAFGVDVDQVLGGGRTRPVAEARIVAMATAHCAGATPHEIAQAFGRDHSTVHHAVRRARSDDNLTGAVTAILSAAFAGNTVRTL